MASEPPAATGRCYCASSTLRAAAAPVVVTYCHCADCRRWTGAPVGAFAAFTPDALTYQPPLEQGFSVVEGVTRWICPRCGSPLAATFDYLPDHIYVPLGLLDNAECFPPEMHCHHGARLSWLGLADDLPRSRTSGRNRLTAR